MTPEEALEAIVARYNGEWDNPSLMKFGPLSTDTADDMFHIAKDALSPLQIADREKEEMDVMKEVCNRMITARGEKIA